MLLAPGCAHTCVQVGHELRTLDARLDYTHASLLAAHVCRRSALAHLDRERPRAQLPSGCVPYWCVVSVEVQGTLTTEVGHLSSSGAEGAGDSQDGGGGSKSGADGKGGGQAGAGERGSISRQVIAHVLFARGPVPREAVPELHSHWFILGWH